eukprot:GHUV01008681.1.p1 GENE.GHUV01008681.1~~GHUV01008681.1.p1  ORF type:complete len:910 (+),score=210.72 GHUV01008681.1:194-2731(+)
MPTFSDVLAQDPYFSVKIAEDLNPIVKLRISRLSQLITNPELIKEYRSPGSATVAAAGTAQSSSSAATAPVKLTDEGLPIRPGQPVCQHYIKHGWCLFKQDCWYSHPPTKWEPANTADTSNLVESYMEPGVMLRNGVYPVRPGRPACAFYLKNGWCLYKAKCRNDHPVLKGAEAAAVASRGSVTSPVQDMPASPLVKQPPTQLVLSVVIDSIWPPRASKENCIKGQLAKHILETQFRPEDAMDPGKAYEVSMAAAGIHLSQWWPTQSLYDPMTKPYRSLADVVKDDPYYRLGRNNQQLSLMFGGLLPAGGYAAAEKLSHMADAVWPPASGRETWLRGKLAKWLITAGFSGENGAVLRKVLTVSPDAATVFRIDMAQAGEYLRRCWEMQEHPYDSSSPPWTQFKPLIAGDRFLYIEAAPGRTGVTHISIDLADMLQSFRTITRAARSSAASEPSQASSSTRVGGAGPSGSAGGASSSSNTAAGDDMMNLQDEEDDALDELVSNTWPALPTPAAASSSSTPVSRAGSSTAAQQRQLSRGESIGGSRPTSATASSIGDPVAEAEADLAALQALTHEPPANMQWWWPEGRPEHPGWAWTEVAIRLVDSAGDGAFLQLAEMTQHLEISPMISMGCAVYKQHPHLLQFFAPHVSLSGLEMPSTVYLIDIMKTGPGVKQVLELIRPVLSSSECVKITHGSKLWSGQLDKSYGLSLKSYFDTQQANFVWNCLRHAAGRAPNMTGGTLKSTESASMSALMRNHDFHHPVRHTQAAQEQPRCVFDNLVAYCRRDAASARDSIVHRLGQGRLVSASTTRAFLVPVRALSCLLIACITTHNDALGSMRAVVNVGDKL